MPDSLLTESCIFKSSICLMSEFKLTVIGKKILKNNSKPETLHCSWFLQHKEENRVSALKYHWSVCLNWAFSWHSGCSRLCKNYQARVCFFVRDLMKLQTSILAKVISSVFPPRLPSWRVIIRIFLIAIANVTGWYQPTIHFFQPLPRLAIIKQFRRWSEKNNITKN